MIADRATIFALSTGLPPSGIAVVRVSGPRAGRALQMVAGTIPQPRHATRATLRADDDRAIDDALVLWFPNPHSATGEDVAEFHVHGGRAILAVLLATLAGIEGLRPAEPGEFTRRGFENGKLDLVAAEALDDLIHADTEQQRRQALQQLGGLLGDRARDWRQRIIDASAVIEAMIDFSDEGDVTGDLMASGQEAIRSLLAEIDAVLADSGRSEKMRDGLIVALVGAPNVGKSTLLNALVRRDVAIVSPHAGTTRDVLEAHLDLGGYPVTLVDTAGLREAADPVEQEGIRRAEARAAAADLVLWLDDSGFQGDPPTTGAELWRIATKVDIGSLGGDLMVSAATGDGVEGLVTAIEQFARGYLAVQSGLITRTRHRLLLTDTCAALRRAQNQTEPELVAEELRIAVFSLGRLLGRVDVEDILGNIFGRFCIGK